MKEPTQRASDEQATDNFFEQEHSESANTLEEYEEKNAKLKVELSKVDKRFVEQICENIYLCCVRVGFIWKCTHRVLKSDEWSEKFCVLTNAGFVYFNTKKRGDYDPRKFYPLNDFTVQELEEKQVKGRKWAFKIVFERHEVSKDLVLAASSQLEREQWIIALKEHRRQFLEARIKIFERRLK